MFPRHYIAVRVRNVGFGDVNILLDCSAPCIEDDQTRECPERLDHRD